MAHVSQRKPFSAISNAQVINYKIFIFVGRGGFAPPKSPKRHSKHELDADLSTSSFLTFSSRIYQKVVFLLVHRKTIFIYFSNDAKI